jgi:hypothetical protein
MNLPPSIEALVIAALDDIDRFELLPFTQQVAHEACRLQREADIRQLQTRPEIIAPLVVEKPT